MEDLLAHAPQFTTQDAERLARELYGVTATARSLTSERDQNFHLRAASGEQFVLKIANSIEDSRFLEAQREAMALASARTGLCPRVLPLAPDPSKWAGEIQSAAGARHAVRLVTFIPGTPAGDVRYHSAAYRRDLGRSVAAVDRALEGFDHPAAQREFHWDLARGVETCRTHLALVRDAATRELVASLVDAFERDVSPALASLPRSVIHNDANDHNVIVRDDGDLYEKHQRVAGIIDFGDMVRSVTVGGLAIAAAYALLGERDPLAAAAEVVGGYHGERPLSETELRALFGLIRLRLCTSVVMAAEQLRQRPDDPYLAVSQAPIMRALPILARVRPRFAEGVFRRACGIEPSAASSAVRAFVAKHAGTFAPILGEPLTAGMLTHLALDVASPIVNGDPAQNAEPVATPRIFAEIAARGARVAFGGYGEARMVYAAAEFADPVAAPGERRTVHLGIDLFAPAGTPVHAPLDGVVFAAANNAQWLDYGPVIILEHKTDDGTPFWSLYGHQSVESLKGMTPGRRIMKGERFSAFGAPNVNGGWTPHLHFQLITDLFDLGTQYPGVARPSQRAVWLSFNPDPSAVLGIPRELQPVAQPTFAETLETRRARLGPNLSIAYREPVKIVRGAAQYLFDEQGRRYIDAYNNVPHVGHAHPRVVRAASEQLSVLNTNTRYLHDSVNELAGRICATLPEPLRVCWFVNSGSEANELALRLARAHTRRRDTIVLEAAYHGNTNTLIDISPYKHAGPGGAGAPEWVHTVPIPDVYRGEFKAGDPRAGEKYAAHVERLAARVPGLGAFIAESLPSVGGQIVFPSGYLAAVYRHVRAAGGVCIADEVQTGYGRIGTHFWGFESQGVVPDIVVLGKPMGNGYPIGAVITTPEIAASFDNGMEYFSTFGGSTVSAAIGLAVLEVVHTEQLQEHGRMVGSRMLSGLRSLTGNHSLIGDVRGSGLFLGVELVKNRGTLEPAADAASYVSNRMREEGILLGIDGPHHNVVKIRPPMPFSNDDADELVATLDGILGELEAIS
ncbi:MAG TPA: aminotransferase class III-fold pyridoxal phosphate-dependent enzyme [Gemmatimonadaceae bacterium]|jgi:4-aminobutyrate aminotransferase-like enzyme/Ser/Thr protein kinase RdoA (MazF antagonist)